MRVKMITTICSPEGNCDAGKIYECSDERAKALIAGGYAEGLDPLPEKKEEPKTESSEGDSGDEDKKPEDLDPAGEREQGQEKTESSEPEEAATTKRGRRRG